MIEPELHARLVSWAQWCRGSGLPRLDVHCTSAESNWLPPAINIYQTASEALQAVKPAKPVSEAIQVEIAVLRLPDKPRLAVRLHYVVHKRMPMQQKFRRLGVGEEGYWSLLDDACTLLRMRLG